MYNDTALRAADENVANVLQTALASSKAGAGVVYEMASQKNQRFDLTIDVENDTTKNYYGYTDVVYTGAGDSFLFGPEKLNVLKATAGLSLRIVLNLGHATDGGQRLSTLTHEIGVHGTLIYGAMVALTKKWESLTDESAMKGALATQLNNGAFSADYHHTQFGGQLADDYIELKARVQATLEDWGSGPIWKLASLVNENKWALLLGGFLEATKRGEDGHADVYWHPKVQFEAFLKGVESIVQSAQEFNDRNKSQSKGGLLSYLQSLIK